MVKKVEFPSFTSKKEVFLFDSLGFEGFKELILQDDQEILNKILYGIKKFNKNDYKITF